MVLSAIIVFGLIAVSNARPNTIGPHNVVVVPPNCPPGQQLVNGQCRDVWRLAPAPIYLPELLIPFPAPDTENAAWDFMEAKPRSDEAVPKELDPNSIISVPNQCPLGYKPDALGICRRIF